MRKRKLMLDREVLSSNGLEKLDGGTAATCATCTCPTGCNPYTCLTLPPGCPTDFPCPDDTE